MRAAIGIGPVDVAANVDLRNEELVLIGSVAILGLILAGIGSANSNQTNGGTISLGTGGPSYTASRSGSAGILSTMFAEASTVGQGGTEVGVNGIIAGEGILGSILVWRYILPYVVITTIIGIIVAIIGILLEIIGLMGEIIVTVLSMRPVIGIICAIRSIFDRDTADRLCGCIACREQQQQQSG
jgi:hypothetical protein